MDTCEVVSLAGAGVIAVILVVVFYSLRLQRKAVGAQGLGMSKVDASLALSREALELQREAVGLAKELVALQKDTNRLLAAISKE